MDGAMQKALDEFLQTTTYVGKVGDWHEVADEDDTEEED